MIANELAYHYDWFNDTANLGNPTRLIICVFKSGMIFVPIDLNLDSHQWGQRQAIIVGIIAGNALEDSCIGEGLRLTEAINHLSGGVLKY
jgi:hypothetical protein